MREGEDGETQIKKRVEVITLKKKKHKNQMDVQLLNPDKLILVSDPVPDYYLARRKQKPFDKRNSCLLSILHLSFPSISF